LGVAGKALSHAVDLDAVSHHAPLDFPLLSLSLVPLVPLAPRRGSARHAVGGVWEKKNRRGEVCQGALKNKAVSDE
jgi:hypothetical protein